MTTSGSAAKKSGLLSMLAQHPVVVEDEPSSDSAQCSASLQSPLVPAPSSTAHVSQSSSSSSSSKPQSNPLNSLCAYSSDSDSESDSDPQPPESKRSRSDLPASVSADKSSARAVVVSASTSHVNAGTAESGAVTRPFSSRAAAATAPFRPFDASAVESDSDDDEDVVGPADALLGPDLTHILGSSLVTSASAALDVPFSFASPSTSESAFVGPARPTDYQYQYQTYETETADAIRQSGHADAALPATAAASAPRVPSVLRRMMEDRPEAVVDVSVPAKLASDAELLKQITADEQTRQWMARFSHGPDSRAKLAVEANPDLASAQHGIVLAVVVEP